MDTLAQRRLARCYSVGDLRRAAKKRLPRAVFDFADGAAEDETTMHRNSAGFDGHDLVPSTLVDVADVRMATSVLGQPVELPVILAPTGMTRLFHPDGETAVARAGHGAGTIYTLSAMSKSSSAAAFAAAPMSSRLSRSARARACWAAPTCTGLQQAVRQASTARSSCCEPRSSGRSPSWVARTWPISTRRSDASASTHPGCTHTLCAEASASTPRVGDATTPVPEALIGRPGQGPSGRGPRVVG